MRVPLVICFFISTTILCGQSIKPIGFVLRYQKVIEFAFNQKLQDYVATDTIEFSGAISVDPKKVFIKSYNEEQDKKLKIIELQKEEGTDRDMYLCEIDGERYAVAISPDKRYLTQIGINDKYIYELMHDDTKRDKNTDEIHFVNLKKDPNSKVIYTLVEKMPLYDGSNNQEESTKLLYNYIEQRVKEDKFDSKGIVYVRFLVNKDGKTEDIEVVRGINSDCDSRAISYVKEMPIWTPGEQKGQKANVQYTIAIKIK